MPNWVSKLIDPAASVTWAEGFRGARRARVENCVLSFVAFLFSLKQMNRLSMPNKGACTNMEYFVCVLLSCVLQHTVGGCLFSPSTAAQVTGLPRDPNLQMFLQICVLYRFGCLIFVSFLRPALLHLSRGGWTISGHLLSTTRGTPALRSASLPTIGWENCELSRFLRFLGGAYGMNTNE